MTWPSDQKQPSLCCHFNHIFNPTACCVCLQLFFDLSTSSTPIVRADSSSYKALYVATSLETCNIYTSLVQQDTRCIRDTLMHVASRLYSWSMAAGLLVFSSRKFAPTINHGPLSASHHISIFPSWASEAGGRCRPRSEAPCISYMYEWAVRSPLSEWPQNNRCSPTVEIDFSAPLP